MVPSAAAKLTSSTALNVPKALLSPLTSMLPAMYRASLELFRLNVSIPIRSTIENSASVRATTYPWVLVLVEGSQNVKRGRLRLPWRAPLTMSTAPTSPIARAAERAVP